MMDGSWHRLELTFIVRYSPQRDGFPGAIRLNCYCDRRLDPSEGREAMAPTARHKSGGAHHLVLPSVSLSELCERT
ncbi:hypothetical protein KUCAC02_001246, partial [Chaenocephalus aceratus]